MSEEVSRQVSSALNSEIRRLPALLDEFERPFHPDSAVLSVYKQELGEHLESALSRNLQHRCSTRLMQSVEDIHKQLRDALSAMLPQEVRQQITSQIIAPVLDSAVVGGYRDLNVIYSIDCQSLCNDFQEDIDFHFSLGLKNILQKWFGWNKTASKFQETLFRRDSAASSVPLQVGDKGNNLAAMVVSNMADTAARSAVGLVVVGFVAFKMVGWRILVIGGAMYGGLYLYERATWTIHAKERAFKKQYARYCSAKLQQVSDLTSAGCAHQVHQHVHSIGMTAIQSTARVKDEWENELNTVVQKTVAVEEANNRSKILRNRAGWVDGEMNSFIHNYLSST